MSALARPASAARRSTRRFAARGGSAAFAGPVFAAVWALVLVTGCHREKKDAQDPKVVAVVNGEALKREDFERELSRDMPALEGGESPTPEQLEPMKKTLLDSMIRQTLLLQAARSVNIVITPEEVDRYVLRESSDYPADNFSDALAKDQVSMAELKQKTQAELTIEKLFQEHVYPRVGVTEEEIRNYYESHPAEFQAGEAVRAAQIVVKGLDEAKRIQAQLKAGKKFADLARRYSLSPDAKVGGDLGFFERGIMPPQFDEVAFKLRVNEVSDVVATDYGYHLFKLLEKRPAHRKELPEVRRQIELKILEEKRQAAQAAFEKALREKAEIRVNDRTLQAITVKPSGSSQRLAEP